MTVSVLTSSTPTQACEMADAQQQILAWYPTNFEARVQGQGIDQMIAVDQSNLAEALKAMPLMDLMTHEELEHAICFEQAFAAEMRRRNRSAPSDAD